MACMTIPSSIDVERSSVTVEMQGMYRAARKLVYEDYT
jgi:hypothetical protein